MVSRAILKPILNNDAITRGLADPEARILIEWLVAQAERLYAVHTEYERTLKEVETLCLRARAIGRFVRLWNEPRSRGAACQLAATERFSWPLPTAQVDPCDLMLDILAHESFE